MKKEKPIPTLSGYVFMGLYDGPEHGDRGVYAVSKDSGKVERFSELYIRQLLEVNETRVHNMPPVKSLQQLFDRCNKSLQVTPVVGKATLSLDEMTALMDYRYGEQDYRPQRIDREELRRQDYPWLSNGPEGADGP